MPDDEWTKILEGTHRAVRTFARAEFQGLGRKAVYRLQRLDASDIFLDAIRAKTLWDEFCYEVQEGPHDLLDWAWDSVIYPILDEVIEQVPHETAVLLSIYAAWDNEEFEAPDLVGTVWHDGLRQTLNGQVRQAAANRPLSRILRRW